MIVADLAIRTTPALLGLFSPVTQVALRQMSEAGGAYGRQTTRYHRIRPTFADVLAYEPFHVSPWESDTIQVPRVFVERLTDVVCFAA